MLAVPMNMPHSSPYQFGGERFDQLAPPRARSTSPLQRLRGFQYRSRATQPDDSHECTAHHDRAASFTDFVTRNEQNLIPAPLRASSGKKSRPSSSRKSNDEATFLQPNVYSSHGSDLEHDTLYLAPREAPQPPQKDYVLEPSVYSQPESERRRRHHTIQPGRHSFDPPVISEPQRPRQDTLTRYRNQQNIAASASAPVTPRYVPQWIDPPRSSQTMADYRKSTFATADDFGLFAEALSGLGPEPDSDPASAASDSVPTMSSNNPIVSPITPEDQIPAFAPFPLRHMSSNSTFPPIGSAATSAQPMQPTSYPASFGIGSSPLVESPQTAIQRDLALSGAMIGLNIESNPREETEDIDDELPGYEQSQREAADQARLKALSRAAELEKRWAASAPHRMRGR